MTLFYRFEQKVNNVQNCLFRTFCIFLQELSESGGPAPRNDRTSETGDSRRNTGPVKRVITTLF